MISEQINHIRELMLSEENIRENGFSKLKETLDILKSKNKVLLLSTSNLSSLNKSNVIKKIETGMICIGQNFNGNSVVDLQKEIHTFYGFKPNNKLYWNWQYTTNSNDESQDSYKKAYTVFIRDMRLKNK